MNLNKTIFLETVINNPDDYTELISVLKTDLGHLPSCILLKGNLGAGKTTFIHQFCKTYGLNHVSSPTFSLHQSYQNSKIKIEHFDLYRLTTFEEIETSGLWEIVADLANTIIFIEWSERISYSDLPLDRRIYELEIHKLDETKRHFQLSRFFR